MSIPALGAIAPILPIATQPLGAAAAGSASGSGFASQLASGLNNLQAVQGKADDLGVQAASGTLTDPSQYTIAATEASLATELTVAVRNKALDAFNEILRMQV
ncbi:MAG: flagellar hook-basal body complex protein FliE [Pseudonocardiales bacterium]|nr:MAG: flagellar hook-basal body complex protein FliE [Pseudonocardiales bacterium]